jgi:hypothetical protein
MALRYQLDPKALGYAEHKRLSDLARGIEFLASQLNREEDIAYFDAQRRECAAFHDEMKAAQKSAGRDGRFFKEAASDAMKHYRAACLWLGLVAGNGPGDSPYVPVSKWRIELWPALYRLGSGALA